jgi:DNA-binding NarL/FixJ family response regulator
MKVLLVDDHDLFRCGLRLLLADLSADLQFVEAPSFAEALADPDARSVDLVLADLHLPGSNGLDGLRRLREQLPGATLVVLSGENDPARIHACIEAGAAGFIPKASTHAVMMAALRLVLAGGVYLPAHALHDPKTGQARALGRAESTSPNLQTLSTRQLDALRLAIQGKPNKLIARELSIAEATVKSHLSAAFRALGVRNRTEAVFAAGRLGLVL